MAPSRNTPLIEARTKSDWSNRVLMLSAGGSEAAASGIASFTALTMSSVEALPFFSTDINVPRTPSCRTMLVCGVKPSRICATSRMVSVEPWMVRTGRLFSSEIVVGVPFISTAYSMGPSLAVPDGVIRFCALTALTMSLGVSPNCCSFAGSRSTITWRCLPPYGYGSAAPCTVASCVRRKLLPRSKSCCSGSVLLESPNWMIGVVEAV